jgi:hypothetical protein
MEQAPNNSRRNAMLGTAFGLLGFAIAYFGVQQIFFKTPTFDKGMMEAASQLNASCPIMIDKDTRLDNAAAMPNKVFQYYYTLVNVDQSEVNVDTLRKYMEPVIVNGVRTSPDLRAYRDNKVTMDYHYRDKNGVFLMKISVTPELYAQ